MAETEQASNGGGRWNWEGERARAHSNRLVKKSEEEQSITWLLSGTEGPRQRRAGLTRKLKRHMELQLRAYLGG